MEQAYRQACMNLATIRPDLTREGDWTLGEFADLYYDALLDGWGGILGYDPGRKPGASNPANRPLSSKPGISPIEQKMGVEDNECPIGRNRETGEYPCEPGANGECLTCGWPPSREASQERP